MLGLNENFDENLIQDVLELIEFWKEKKDKEVNEYDFDFWIILYWRNFNF